MVIIDLLMAINAQTEINTVLVADVVNRLILVVML
jgi:hypothetical protein